MDHLTNVHELKEKVKNFCEVRDWDQFHSAKELAIGIVTEAGELLDLFRYKSPEEIEALFVSEKRVQIVEELSDVFYGVLRLAQRYDIDLTTELLSKMALNDKKYPVDKIKGSNKKYNEI